jgi:hypothetical protein
MCGVPNPDAKEGYMILTCNYEEITAVGHGARAYLDDKLAGDHQSAEPETRAAVEALVDRLGACISLRTLSEQQEIEEGLAAVVEYLRAEVDLRVLMAHPAAEESVVAYFDFAHALSVFARAREIGEEMSAMVEVMTGAPPDESSIAAFVFPD